jgi:NTE family protein
MKKFKTGLVLSGGAARGLAHAGVLQALDEADIHADIISGVSAGAIVGALYADGYRPKQILEFFLEKSMLSYVKPAIPRRGLLRMSGLEEILKENLHAKRIEELKIPLCITTTDIHTGKALVFTTGKLIPLIIASSSIPVMFVPIEIEGLTLVDGGVVDNFPIDPIRDQCEFLIGVHVNPIGTVQKIEGILDIAERTFNLTVAAQIEKKIHGFDIFMEPNELRNYGYTDVKKAKEIYNIGYKEAKRVLEIKASPRKTAS